MSNKQLRELLEKKYNINLDVNETLYWDLRDYFTKEIKLDNILIPTDYAHICCHRQDIDSMIEEFNNKLKDLIKNDPGPCSDPYKVGCLCENR